MSATSLQGLRVFCAAARSGSFKVAAEEIFVSASAVSHRIKNLEDQLGAPLFERQTRSVKLTEFGETLLQKIYPLIEKIDSEIEIATGLISSLNITLTLPPFFSTELLIPKLHEFTSKHPNIVINLDTVNGYPQKHQNASDLSILLCTEKPLEHNSVELFPLLLIPACSPAMCFDRNLPLSETLENMTLLIHRPRRNAWKRWYKTQGFRGKAPGNIILLDSMIAVVRAAEQGLGIALIPEALTANWFENSALEKLPGKALVTGDAYYLVSNNENLHKKEVKQLYNWITTRFQSIYK